MNDTTRREGIVARNCFFLGITNKRKNLIVRYENIRKESRKKCVELIDEISTCSKYDSLGELLNRHIVIEKRVIKKDKKGVVTCRFSYPRLPMRQTDILSPLEDDFGVQEKKYKEIYESIAEKTEEIVTNDGI